MKNLWDEKAKNYARFDGSASFFCKKIDEFCETNFKDKKIIDIGCGTGVNSLYFAKLAKSTHCLDISEKMLEIAAADAAKFDIKISTECVAFADFKSKEFYDIALCMISPALQKKDEFLKFSQLAKSKIYLGFAGCRTSLILDNLIDKNLRFKGFLDVLKSFLDEYKIKAKIHYFSEKRNLKRSLNEALEIAKWHFAMNKIAYDEKMLEKYLENKVENGVITECVETPLVLCSWQ